MSMAARVLGVVFVLLGVLIAFMPDAWFSAEKAGTAGVRYSVAGFRLLAGVILIMAAGASRFPKTFRFFGVFSLLAGVFAVVITARVYGDMVAWATSDAMWFLRPYGSVLVILAGAFISYGAIAKLDPPAQVADA